MKQVITLLLLAIAISRSCAQSTGFRGVGYFEAGGPAGHLSLNYERLFSAEKGFALRVGAGTFLSNAALNFSFPLGIQHYLPLNGRTRLQTGLGITWAESALTQLTANGNPKESSIVYFTPSIGFQLNGSKRGYYRFAFTPIIGDGTWLPWAGLAVGTRF